MPPGPPPRRDQIVMILVMLAALVGLLVMKDRCGKGVDNLFRGFEAPTKRAASTPFDAGR
ncbi:MAG: hypothetical protein EXR72_24940 [Myxococcales bacterium]|nr:hypothetical protein [Myxococcales bacterium]